MKYKFKKTHLLLIVLIIIICGAIGSLIYQNYLLGVELLRAEENLTATSQNLKAVIDSTRQKLEIAETERDDFEQKYLGELSRLNLLDVQLQGIQGVVAMLEKLYQTDPELLKKYSKVYFLNENYIPATLVKVDQKYTYYSQQDYLFLFGVLPFLQDLMAVAGNGNIDIKIISAYRSFGTQADIKAMHKIIYGSGANAFSADQGYSEHQLGTTVDFTTSEIGNTFTGFEKTPTYQWLLDNAYKYGFILSYPKGNQYYQFEPWHWRFVGRSLAGKLYQAGQNFYDLDQREIDQYLLSFFD